jgi:hypothetical protein
VSIKPVRVERILTNAQRVARSAQRSAQQITALADAIARLQASDYIPYHSKFSEIVLTCSQALTLQNYKLSVLTKLFDLLARQSDAASESAQDSAELAADTSMVYDDKRLDYLLLAQQIADLHPYLFDKVLIEVARRPRGWRQIEALDKAIDRIVKGE